VTRRGELGARLWIGALCAALLCFAALPAAAVATDPLFIYTPVPQPAMALVPPPAGFLDGPCGLAVDSAGRFYVSDYYHDAIDRFSSAAGYSGQLAGEDPSDGPCGLAVDSAGALYVDNLNGEVARFASFPSGAKATLDPGPATGVAVNPATGDVYVDDRTYISVYDPAGAPVEVSGEPLRIGSGSLEDGYGIAVSGYSATRGFLYVPDAAGDTVKVYDPATDGEDPVGVIAAGFSSLRDAAIAVDNQTGEVYVADDLQPEKADEPEAAIFVFAPNGAYEGRLKYNIVDPLPPGLAVDNSGTSTQSRVYVTSGNTERASVIAYPPAAAGAEALPAPEGPVPLAPGQGAEAPLPGPPPPVTCEGDSCQRLPPEPTDPTLDTLIEGAANPPVRFHDTNRLPHYQRLRHHHHRRHQARHPGRHRRQGRR
jgi:DNA-binding beta-propeller fold protein YncE